MRQVTSEEFFKALSADPRDIMPNIVSEWDNTVGYISEWRCQKTRELFGESHGTGANGSWFLCGGALAE